MQYERLEDGDYDEYGETKPPMPRSTKFVLVASLLATVGFAGAAWYSDSMPSLSELASSPSSEPIVSVFSNNDRIENVQPSSNTESSEDCPDCASHSPPALTSSPELNKEDRIENVQPSSNTESSEDCPDCASHTPPALTSSPATFFRLSSKKVTCDACDSLGDADCLSLLQSALDSVDDLTEKLALEKEILSHKYSCGSSLSDDSCLSYLDGKMGTLTNDEQLSLLTEACSAGNLPVDAPPAAEVTEEVPDGTDEADAPEDTDEAKAPEGFDEAQAPEGSDEAQAPGKRMQQH